MSRADVFSSPIKVILRYGEKGERGVGISSVVLDDRTHLIVTYDNGKTQDAGVISCENELLDIKKNISKLMSTYSGTDFPTENLVTGLKCYRTDLNKTYTYNGETWDDEVNTSSLTVSGETSVPTPSTGNSSKTIANTEFVHGVVNDLVNGAPTALDTLQELATALGNDPNFSTTILNKIGEKESKTDAQIEYKRLQDAIPTKVSQLSNDSGYQKTAEIPVASQTQNGYMSKSDKAKLDGISLDSYVLKTELGNYALKTAIPTKTSQLTNDTGYITKADISTPDLTPYMKKTADSDLRMGVHKLIFGTTKISDDYRNTVPMFTIDATGGRGVNIEGPSVLVNGTPIATETDLSKCVKSINNITPDSSGNVNISTSGGGTNITVDTELSGTSNNAISNKAVYEALSGKLDKTGTAAAATKATQDGAGNVIATTYIKTVNNLKPDLDGNVNISGGTGGNITVDSVLSPTSTNAIQNRVVQQEFTSVRAAIPTKVSQLTNDSGYLTQHQSLDGYVKTVNNTAPDSNGNVTIALSGGGGVSTSESNTWTGKQTFQNMKFNFESYNAPRISGATDNPSGSVAVYNVQGNFTLDMSELAGLLSNGDATIFTAYITANGSYTLSITNAGTLKYAGNAADLAITANGLLLNIFLTKSASGVVTSIAQATKLS